MDIEKIREKIAEIEYAHSDRYEFDWSVVKYSQPILAQGFYYQADQILSTEIVPERECEACKGSGDGCLKFEGSKFVGNFSCRYCKGTGKLPPVTVEQAIRDILSVKGEGE